MSRVNKMEEKIYKHSGESHILGIMIALGLGAALAIFLGFIYTVLIVLIPIVYANFFMTIGFGTILGYSMKFFSRFGKIRNGKQQIILAGAVGFIGFYFQWIAYFVFLNSGEHSFQAYQENFNLLYDPGFFIFLIIDLNKTGSWEMFGIMFTDFPLWIIWGLEALIIIGIPIIINAKHPIIPYSELLNKWYSKYNLKTEFENIATQRAFKDDLLQNVEKAIDSLGYGGGYRFSQISIFYLKDEENQYLSVENIFIEERGKGKTHKTSVVHLLKVDTITANNLMEKFGKKKLFLLDY